MRDRWTGLPLLEHAAWSRSSDVHLLSYPFRFAASAAPATSPSPSSLALLTVDRKSGLVSAYDPDQKAADEKVRDVVRRLGTFL